MLRWGAVSVRIAPRSVVVGTVAWALVAAVGLHAVTVRDFPMPVASVLDTLAGNGTLLTYDVVVRNRVPRVLVAVLVGAAFALSGAVFQRLAHNPLVSPDVIGINAGASAGAVVAIVVLGASAGGVVSGALVGAAGAALLVYAVAYRAGFSGYRLVLVGIGVAAILSAAGSFLLSRSDHYAALRAAVWLVGSVAGRTWHDVWPVATGLAVLGPALLLLSRQLRLLELGDDLARTLAGRVEVARTGLLACAVGLAALATASAGPVGFVALVAPQMVRRLLGERSAGLVPSAGVGALVVVAADLLGRTAFSPYELPVGVLTALVGAPVLLYLLVRANKIGASG